MIVMDASLAAAWLLHETEAVPTETLVEVLSQEPIIVPPHWPTEVGNALRRAVRTGRLERTDIRAMVERLALLDVTKTQPLASIDISALVDFALEHGLSVYDAAYLRLAADQRLPLATVDVALRNAAKGIGVEVLPA